MPYFTEDDIKKRISGINRNYNLDLKIIGSNEIRICMKKNEEIYEMKIFFGVIQEYNIFKNDKLVYNYQKDSNGNLILSDDNYECGARLSVEDINQEWTCVFYVYDSSTGAYTFTQEVTFSASDIAKGIMEGLDPNSCLYQVFEALLNEGGNE